LLSARWSSSGNGTERRRSHRLMRGRSGSLKVSRHLLVMLPRGRHLMD